MWNKKQIQYECDPILKCEDDFSISEIFVQELLHFICNAFSAVFNAAEFYESKGWDIWKVFSDAKTLVKFKYRKLVFVKVESSLEISENVHWSEIVLGS